MLLWWGTWVFASALLFVITVLWSFRDSTQALADGVLLHAVADLLVAAVAVLTALVVRRITTLLLQQLVILFLLCMYRSYVLLNILTTIRIPCVGS